MHEPTQSGAEGALRDFPVFDRFEAVLDADRFRPVPDGWHIAVADIVDSTGAIAAGRYKDINFVGAAPIAAVMNALGDHDLPFAFGGDGCAIALPAGREGEARAPLAAAARWARDEFDLGLRVGLASIEEVRAAGQDVRLGLFQASPDVRYAMFSGGGISWAERQLKDGALPEISPAGTTRPDLTGLSCRWQPMESRHGVILSVIAAPANGAEPGAAVDALGSLLDAVRRLSSEGSPVPDGGPRFRWPPSRDAIEREVRAGQPEEGPPAKRRRKVRMLTAVARLMEILNLKMGGFDARRYREVTGRNADFRKRQDGVYLTLDCTEDEAARIEADLEAAARAGVLRYGTFRQKEAIMTCIVPSPLRDDHVHFVDGAGGGYARAAEGFKASPG